METVDELLKRYREAAIGHGSPNPVEANEWHDRLHACYKVLRQTEAGRQAIGSLMDDGDPGVRSWAAAHSLQWFPERARSVLEALCSSDAPWQVAFSAEMTLKEYDNGRLTFDY
jgi:hypothetical protein